MIQWNPKEYVAGSILIQTDHGEGSDSTLIRSKGSRSQHNEGCPILG